ncbi:MAG TPA: lactate utilization protein, partial [Pseudomonas sp.]|nr:lactate utilization protein [Pseudomonas sp.]
MSAKANILAKLKKSLEGTTPVVDDYDASLVTQPWSYAPEQRIARLRQLMEAVHTEIHLTTDAGWPALLEQLL